MSRSKRDERAIPYSYRNSSSRVPPLLVSLFCIGTSHAAGSYIGDESAIKILLISPRKLQIGHFLAGITYPSQSPIRKRVMKKVVRPVILTWEMATILQHCC
jgi:hypothetical protein